MNIDEAIKLLNYQIEMKDTDVYVPINYDAIKTLINEYNNLKQIEEAHRIENGKLREEISFLENEIKGLKETFVINDDSDKHIPYID